MDLVRAASRRALHSVPSRLAQRRPQTVTSRASVSKLREDISLCVVGNGAFGNPRSLIVDCNDRLLMFNCGEGLQRNLSEFGFKSTKIEQFFITSNNWSNVSGLNSLLLARFDANIKEFNINGLNSNKIIEECIRFDTKLRRVKFNHFDCLSETSVDYCNDVNIRPVVVKTHEGESIVYLGCISAQKGSINLEKCFELRVPRHLVSKLENGIPVPLANGDTILPEQVTNADQPEKRFIIFEPLSPPFLKSLERNSTVCDFLHSCDCVVHFVKSDLLQHADYKYFMQNQRKGYHLLITESNPTLSLYSAHRFQNQLNIIDSDLFPILREPKNVTKAMHRSRLFDNDKVIHSPAGLSFQLRPHTSDESSLITFEKLPKEDIEDREKSLIYKDGSVREGVTEVLASLEQMQKSVVPDFNLNYPEFIFLGTASSCALPIRNVSAILVHLSPSESVLLDCGDGTYGQLLRFYGEANMKETMSKLKLVFISHHHSDHHMGLVQLIERHHELTGTKLHVILPPMVSKFLHSKSMCFSSLNDLSSKYNYTINSNFTDGVGMRKLLTSVELVQLTPVSHCAFAYAFGATTKTGFKFVYSGDTEPCDSLVKAGQNCDLLIHEATVEDRLVTFARTNFHSTNSEAIDVGRRMNARFTILTHFSQRYGKLPFVDGNTEAVGLAFDNMRVSPSQFCRLPLMRDALKCFYAKHLENIEYRSEMYTRKFGT